MGHHFAFLKAYDFDMKKVLLILVLATLITTPAQAAMKAGSVCKKVGATSISAGVKYTCIKSGKKLIWNKGMKISTPTPPSSPTPVAATSMMPTTPAVISLTKTEIALHNKQSDCWSYMGEKVYNLTSWMSEHPGGAEIMLEMCGNDGSASFGSHHSSEVDAYLAQYFVGKLIKA